MAERERANRGKHEDVDQKKRARQKEPQISSDNFHAWDQGLLPLAETPFHPRMDEHAAILSRFTFARQRHNFIIQLQKTYGNRYVQRLVESMNVQAKLTVSDPGDIYEQEADRVADTVTRAVNSPAQRQEEEEEVLQGKPFVQRQEEEEVQAKTLLQRQQEEEEELQTQAAEEEEEIQTQPGEGQPATVAEDLETRINSARGGGQPLSDDVRKPMEQALGADFSGVRVHTDSEAHLLSQKLSAKAFTTARDIFFRQDEYSPGSDSGRKLIAHELTHVVQQNGDRVERKSDGDMVDHQAGDTVAQKADGSKRRADTARHETFNQKEVQSSTSLSAYSVHQPDQHQTEIQRTIVWADSKKPLWDKVAMARIECLKDLGGDQDALGKVWQLHKDEHVFEVESIQQLKENYEGWYEKLFPVEEVVGVAEQAEAAKQYEGEIDVLWGGFTLERDALLSAHKWAQSVYGLAQKLPEGGEGRRGGAIETLHMFLLLYENAAAVQDYLTQEEDKDARETKAKEINRRLEGVFGGRYALLSEADCRSSAERIGLAMKTGYSNLKSAWERQNKMYIEMQLAYIKERLAYCDSYTRRYDRAQYSAVKFQLMDEAIKEILTAMVLGQENLLLQIVSVEGEKDEKEKQYIKLWEKIFDGLKKRELHTRYPMEKDFKKWLARDGIHLAIRAQLLAFPMMNEEFVEMYDKGLANYGG